MPPRPSTERTSYPGTGGRAAVPAWSVGLARDAGRLVGIVTKACGTGSTGTWANVSAFEGEAAGGPSAVGPPTTTWQVRQKAAAPCLTAEIARRELHRGQT